MRQEEPDYLLILTTLLLTAAGLIILFSASSIKSILTFGSSSYYLNHQVLYGVIPGLAALFVCYRFDHRLLKRFSFIILLISLAALVFVFVPNLGVSLKGAARWIKIGSATIQPAEFFKLAFIIYLADFFSRRQEKITSFKEVSIPFFVILSAAGAMLLSQPSTGTFGVIALTSFVVYFFAGARIRDILVFLLVGGVIASFLLISVPYRLERVMTLLDPARDPRGAGYQINQALIAIGSGGLWGVGLGHSRQKYNFLPEAIGDSIFAIYAEETGFVGAAGLILAFLIFMHRGLKIALSSRDMFSRLLAVGITVWIVGQAFVNMAALSGLLPLTGLPLPFISYGGSALVAGLAGVGILLNISRYTKK